MNKYKNLPRCPWCGYMMRLRKLKNNDTVYAAYYRCSNCNAPSPQVYAGGEEEVESKAYKFSGIGGGGKQNEKDYGSLWRCWRRKPTKNERENTPWEDEGR